jgi:hypothetical protein
MGEDRIERIKQRAYDYWEEEGRPRGRHKEHWLRAEREIAAEDGSDGREAAAQHHEHPVESVEITTGQEPLEEHIKRTEGP